MSIQSYKDLRVWQEGMRLGELCYQTTRNFPKEEVFGLTGQIRRAAASIPANIAEGYGREMKGDYIHHLRIAQGSLKELETHILLAQRVFSGPIPDMDTVLELADNLGRMIHGLIRTLQNQDA